MEIITLGQQFVNFERMVIIVAAGLAIIFIDGRLMKNRGLNREGIWAAVMGWTLIVAGIAAWIFF